MPKSKISAPSGSPVSLTLESAECPLQHPETVLGSGVCSEGHAVPRRGNGAAIFRKGYAPRIALATRAARKGDSRPVVTTRDCIDRMVQCVTKEARDAWEIYLTEKELRKMKGTASAAAVD